jgi:hypothetical protein
VESEETEKLYNKMIGNLFVQGCLRRRRKEEVGKAKSVKELQESVKTEEVKEEEGSLKQKC